MVPKLPVRQRVSLVGGLLLGALLAGCAAEESPVATRTAASGTSASGSPTSPAASAAASPSPDRSGSAAEQATAESERSQPRARGTVITTGGSAYGPILYDSDRQAIYIWQPEDSAKPRCYGECAIAWPPVLTDAAPVAKGDVAAGKLGTTRRGDGTTQVTYNGHPLYYYADERPGEVRCHNVATHGGLWWVIRPNGKRAP